MTLNSAMDYLAILLNVATITLIIPRLQFLRIQLRRTQLPKTQLGRTQLPKTPPQRLHPQWFRTTTVTNIGTTTVVTRS